MCCPFLFVFLLLLRSISARCQCRDRTVRCRGSELAHFLGPAVACRKIPGWDVIQSSDARIKPDASSLTTSANISFCGICPTAMNTPDTSILKSFPVFLSVRRSPSTAVSPRISFTTVLRTNSIFSLPRSLFTMLSSPRNSSLRWMRYTFLQ